MNGGQDGWAEDDDAGLWQPRVELSWPSSQEGLVVDTSLPFVVAVIGDFAGQALDPQPLIDRPWLDAGAFGMEGLFEALAPRLSLVREGSDDPPVLELQPRRLADFGRDGVAALLGPALEDQAAWVVEQAAWRELHANWTGLAFLFERMVPDAELVLQVWQVSKAELGKHLRRYRGMARDQSAVFRRLYGEGLGTRGGLPIACVVAAYTFDHRAPDVELLSELLQAAAAAHAQVLTAAAPSLMQMESWQELGNPRDLTKIFSTPEYAAWKALRASDLARHLLLALPGFKAPASLDAPWLNPAFAVALLVARAWRVHGWCARVEGPQGGGLVDALGPAAHGRCTEVPVSERREAELLKVGLSPLLGEARQAVFNRLVTLQQPAEDLYDEVRQQGAELERRLPWQLCAALLQRHVHLLMRDLVQQGLDATEVEQRAQAWLDRWVDDDPQASSGAEQALRPLASASISVSATHAEPGVGLVGGWRCHLELSHQIDLPGVGPPTA